VSDGGRNVLVVSALDRFANGLKAVEVQRFLTERGHNVRLFDTYYLSRGSGASANLLLALRAVNLLTRRSRLVQSHLSYRMLLTDLRMRRSLLQETLPLDDFDLVICETPFEAGLLTVPTTARTLYDCPTPWADELFYEGRLTESQREKMREIEIEILESVDFLAYHWQTYAQYAVEHYGISGRNLMTLNFGCNPAARRATFSAQPRAVYIGSLSSRFIDLPLLSRLARTYPIDVYGGPPPDPRLGLNYVGYAVPDVLSGYQVGVITCTKDELRRMGFSAKHLEYIAHGLPVLVPEWRRHLDLIEGSVPYSEDTFVDAIGSLSDETEWTRVSELAYAQAQRLSWSETLRPLDDLLRSL
jgi:hypothetical protein